MVSGRVFPTRGVWRRPSLRPVDLAVVAALVALLYRAGAIGAVVERAVPVDPGPDHGVHRSGRSALLCGALAAAHVRRAGGLRRVHLRLRHGRRAPATGGAEAVLAGSPRAARYGPAAYVAGLGSVLTAAVCWCATSNGFGYWKSWTPWCCIQAHCAARNAGCWRSIPVRRTGTMIGCGEPLRRRSMRPSITRRRDLRYVRYLIKGGAGLG